MVYKKSIISNCKYYSVSCGEDMNWVKQAWPNIKVQARISKVLYYYDANKETSETQGDGIFTKTTLTQPTINI